MHAKSRKISIRASVVYSIALAALFIMIGGGLYIGAHSTASKSGAEIVYDAPQPPTASTIASEEGCTNFTPKTVSSTAHILGVVDLGNCWVDGVKYAINTFASPASRNSWLKISEPFGVVPKWETATSVTYKSID